MINFVYFLMINFFLILFLIQTTRANLVHKAQPIRHFKGAPPKVKVDTTVAVTPNLKTAKQLAQK